MNEINDIRENIEELRDRIVDAFEFDVSVRYFNKDEDEVVKFVRQSDFVKIINEQKEEGLHSLTSENQGNFIQALFFTKTDIENNLEKLLIEIDKIPLVLKTRPFENKLKEEPKIEDNLGEEIPEGEGPGEQQENNPEEKKANEDSDESEESNLSKFFDSQKD